MKAINNKILIAAILFPASLFTFSSCHEKGCTNRAALNYNVTADQDDGSCIICTPQVSNLGSQSVYLVDDNSSSQFYQQQVARYDLTEPLLAFNFTQCGVGSCTIHLVITNLVNKNMSVEYELESTSGPLFINNENNISIPPNGTLDMGIILTFQNPPYTPLSEDSFEVISFGTIDYF